MEGIINNLWRDQLQPQKTEPQLHKVDLICWRENQTAWFDCDTEAWLMWLTTDNLSFYWRGLTASLMDGHDFSCWPAPASWMLTDHCLNNWDRLSDELCRRSSWRPGRGHRLKFESLNLQISLCNECKHCHTVLTQTDLLVHQVFDAKLKLIATAVAVMS